MQQPSSHTFQQCIYQLVQQIPCGYVATYGQVAALCGWPRHARFVGYALYQVAPDSEIPWHRVVNAQGKVSLSWRRGGSDELQRWRLEAEGVVFNANGRINLRRYGWQP
ncbi:methyltransferase [Parathermosynechococcus lividus PCC 6715]|uniref:Methyltransferase n=1 Tax=Parathermosynechococcus lividus PCC 6715 TaxID=1917166 RepID=A0A2D2Q3S3_PARLV|nr:MGMT family protein [Thermostichus lividus]ATS19152.1 methyltransferase [Thermostichus lividus PCC 6715]